jgi:hypothetical protein
VCAGPRVDRQPGVFESRLARHDVDHARERVAAIDRGIGAARDLDAFDIRDVEQREVE